MAIERLLVPIGGSVYEQHALQYAVMFAQVFKAEIQGVYIKDIRFFEGPWFNALVGHVMAEPYFNIPNGTIEQTLDDRGQKVKQYFTSLCRNANVPFTFEICKGFPSDVILSKADGVDIVVMGKKGEHAQWLERDLGSVCLRVIQQIHKPCLVVDHDEPRIIKKLLLCYAGGEQAKESLALAISLMAQGDFSLTVMTVASKKTKAVEVQREARHFLKERKITAHYVMSIGDIEDQIMKVSALEQSDLLIMGASPATHFDDFFYSSLASRILVKSALPVMLVR